MLTKDLVLTRTQNGRLRPAYIDPAQPALSGLAEELVAMAQDAEGATVDELEERLWARAAAFSGRPKVAHGLVKLLLDKSSAEEPGAELSTARLAQLREAVAVLRAQPANATLEDYESSLQARWGQPLAALRERLYADLPGRRKVLAVDVPSPRKLLVRYNLALAQGPLLTAKRVSVRAVAPELLRVRKVLRWLKFCRLVAEVQQVGEDWLLDVEGPAALFTQQKRYGLQLATFLTALPSLARWELTAEVKTGRRTATLWLSHEDPLESPHSAALGHIPEEVTLLAQGLRDEGFTVDTTPVPRHTGARGMCVPDLVLRHGESGRELAIELFHPWHAAALTRRLTELAARPDPGLWLGVDRAVAKEPELRAQLEARADVLLFNGFPSARTLKAKLAGWRSPPE